MSEPRRSKISEHERLQYLSRMDILADLTEAQMAELARCLRVRHYGPGKVFFMPPKAITCIYFVFHGMVHLTQHTECGKRLVVGSLKPGDSFGEKALFGLGQATLAAEAMNQCVIGIIDKEVFSNMMLQNPQLGYRMMELLVQRVKTLEALLPAVAFKPVRTRLVDFLLASASKNGGGEEVKGLTHRDLGDMLGTYRETVTTTLAELRRRGLIETHRKRITVLDRHGLERLAGDQ